MSAQHTPGPWKTGRLHKPSKFAIMTANEAGPMQMIIAYTDYLSVNTSYEIQEANAKLIAAAPELLAELETAVLRIELANAEGNPILSAWLPDARKAIARAKGGLS